MSPKNKSKKEKQATESMVEKTKVKVEQKDEVLGRRVVGIGFAVVGLLLILGIIVLNVLNNVEPKLDEELNVPTLNELDEFTNRDRVVISGTVDDVENVIIYVNEKMQTSVVEVKDGKFEYEHLIPDEGEYAFQAVSVEGFPFRKGSEKSNLVEIIVDWTAPSAEIVLDYPAEVADGLVTVNGEAEPFITVSLLSGEEVLYSVVTDAEGVFEISDIKLIAGENEFRVELEDRAGNTNILARRIQVTSLVDAPEILGQSDIPEASGELFKVFGMMFENNLMFVFGILSLVALLGSSTAVFFKMKREA